MQYTGVFAVASMMTGALRLRLIPDTVPMISNASASVNNESVTSTALDPSITPIMLTSTLALTVGLVQVGVLFGIIDIRHRN